MTDARVRGKGKAKQWTVDGVSSEVPPEWMLGCQTPPREWHQIDSDGFTQTVLHCRFNAALRNADPVRYQALRYLPVADGMYTDADVFNEATRQINRDLIASDADDYWSLAVTTFWPWGVPIARGLFHNELEPQAPGGRFDWPVAPIERGWWLLVDSADLSLLNGLPDDHIGRDEAFDYSLE
jgi:hypothetical protein